MAYSMLFVSYDKNEFAVMTENESPYGVISTTEELGQLVRNHRKRARLTLENTSGLANLSVRFLSEFERGKQTAEIGKVLKALRTLGLEVNVQPRNQTTRHPARGNNSPEIGHGDSE